MNKGIKFMGKDESGFAKAIKTDADGILETKDERVLQELRELKSLQSKTIENLAVSKETSNMYDVMVVPAGTTVEFATHNFPCELVALSIGTDSDRLSLRVENKQNGTFDSGIRLVNPKGTSANPVSPTTLRLIDGENDFWNEFVYDTDGQRFAFGMKRTIVFAKGMRIRLSAHSSKDASVAITYIVQKLTEVS